MPGSVASGTPCMRAKIRGAEMDSSYTVNVCVDEIRNMYRILVGKPNVIT